MKILTAPFLIPISKPSLKDGALVLDEGKIIDLGPKDKIFAKYPDAIVEDFPNSVLMPGLVNAHAHLDLLFFNTAKDVPIDFFNWLVTGWNHRKTLTPTHRRQCLEEGTRQLLQCGTTCVGDAGQFVGIIPQAAKCSMRMVLFPEILTGGESAIQEIYDSVFSQLEEIQGKNSNRLSAGLAPYAAYTLSKHLLKILTRQTRELKIPLKIHVAETFQEMQFFFESSGDIAERLFPAMGWVNQLPPEHRKTPILYLESIGFLENAPTLVGCNHLSETDLQVLVKSGSKVVHSPRSNAHLKLGNPPLKKLSALGVPIALGTDGAGSLYSLSLWDEMRTIQDHYPKADQPKPLELLTMATLNGARALGLDHRVGSLTPGKEADFIAIHAPKDVSLTDLPEWLIAHVTEREIGAVFIEGKRVKV